jgi:hypothetical protein
MTERVISSWPGEQARFAQAIMGQTGDLHVPDERVFSQTVSGRVFLLITACTFSSWRIKPFVCP